MVKFTKLIQKKSIAIYIFGLCFIGTFMSFFTPESYAGVLVGGNPQVSLGQRVSANEFSQFLTNYKGLALAISCICAITSIIMLVVSISRLSVSAGNEQLRRKAWGGIILSGIALALIVGISVVVGVFWHILA